MPLPSHIRRIIYALTVAAWLVVIGNATPLGQYVSDDVRTLAVLVAVVGTFKYLLRRMSSPAHELFIAGKMAGRAEALAEQDDDVVLLDERRALRVVRQRRDQA